MSNFDEEPLDDIVEPDHNLAPRSRLSQIKEAKFTADEAIWQQLGTSEALPDNDGSFAFDLEFEENIGAEIEDFILYSRLGIVDEARFIAEQVLWKHLDHFVVFAELANFFVATRNGGRLRRLNTENRLQESQSTYPIWRTSFLEAVAMIAEGGFHLEFESPVQWATLYRSDPFDHLKPEEVHCMILTLCAFISTRPRQPSAMSANGQTLVHLLEQARYPFAGLLSSGMIWEATQVFSLLCEFSVYTSLVEHQQHLLIQTLRRMYRDLMENINSSKPTLSSRQEEQDSDDDVGKLLCRSEAKFGHLKFVLPRQQFYLTLWPLWLDETDSDPDLPTLCKEIENDLQSLFKMLPDPSPRGQKWEYLKLIGSQLWVKEDNAGGFDPYVHLSWTSELLEKFSANLEKSEGKESIPAVSMQSDETEPIDISKIKKRRSIPSLRQLSNPLPPIHLSEGPRHGKISKSKTTSSSYKAGSSNIEKRSEQELQELQELQKLQFSSTDFIFSFNDDMDFYPPSRH